MYKSLQDYINFLDSKGELTIISQFTDPIYEITKITDVESKKEGGGKALLFSNTGTSFPVITNMMGSEKRMGYALGFDFENGDSWGSITQRFEGFIEEFMKGRSGIFDKMKLLPTLGQAAGWLPKSHSGTPPCQEIVIYPEIGLPLLSKLPVLKCWPLDGGRFITLPLVHTKDPSNGGRNVGMYRMQIFDEYTTGMHWHRHKTGARHFEAWKKSSCDGKMPIAVALGGDPIYTYCATAPLPEGIDEYLLAGFLRGRGVSLAECKTQPLKVPADCDIIIEGYIDTNEEKVIEGPFGDHTGFYSLADLYPKFHLTCITHRKNAVYPATVVGIPPMEDKYIALATEKIFLSPIKFTISPEIIDLHLPEEGVGHNFAIVKIEKSYPGQGQKVASALWGAGQMMFNKFLIIVGAQTDIHNRDSIADAIEQNFLPSRDTIVSKGPLDILDHTATVCGFGGKMAIDATIKTEEEIKTNFSSFKGFNFEYDSEKIFHLTSNIGIILDEDRGLYTNLWILGGNCDPLRDSAIYKEILILDARCKKGMKWFKRDWPDEVRF